MQTIHDREGIHACERFLCITCGNTSKYFQRQSLRASYNEVARGRSFLPNAGWRPHVGKRIFPQETQRVQCPVEPRIFFRGGLEFDRFYGFAIICIKQEELISESTHGI